MVDLVDDLIGQKFGNYRLTRVLGKGGFATVYLGEHILLPTKVAIKVLHTHLPHGQIDTFLIEARHSVPLRHPNIVRILDFGEERKIPYLVMDYASNTLRKRHPRGTAIPLPTLASYVQQVASALQYAHSEHKLIHRDIKPENMLLGPQGEILLSDFGISQVYQSSLASDEVSKGIAGTVPYMAPEQFHSKASFASDQYALGIVTYEWLCGKPPFQGSTYVEVALQHELMEPPSLHEKIALDRPEIEAVVRKALAKKPELRFDTIQAYADALVEASTSTSHSPSSHAKTHILAERVSEQDPTPTALLAPTTKPQSISEQDPTPTSIPLNTPVPEQTRTISAEEEIDDMLLTDPFQKQETGTALVAAPLSVVPRPKIGRTWQDRRRLLGLVLLLSVISAFTYAFWPSGLLRPDTIKTTTPNPTANPELGLVVSHIENPTATPTAIPTSSPTAVSRFSSTAIPASNPTAAPVAANTDPYPPNGKLALDDPLSDNSRGYGWKETGPPSPSGGGACQFIGGAYHAIETQNAYIACEAAQQVSNFTFEVQMQIIQGNCGGLSLRDSYYFMVCQNGSYGLSRLDSLAAGWQPLTSGSSGAIVTGLNQSNVIAGVANGSTFDLYVNRQKIASVIDGNHSYGPFGVSNNGNTEAVYTHARMWTL